MHKELPITIKVEGQETYDNQDPESLIQAIKDGLIRSGRAYSWSLSRPFEIKTVEK